MRLRAISGHGSWRGADVLAGLQRGADDGPIAVLTRADVRWRSWRAFRAASRAVSGDLLRAPGSAGGRRGRRAAGRPARHVQPVERSRGDDGLRHPAPAPRRRPADACRTLVRRGAVRPLRALRQLRDVGRARSAAAVSPFVRTWRGTIGTSIPYGAPPVAVVQRRGPPPSGRASRTGGRRATAGAGGCTRRGPRRRRAVRRDAHADRDELGPRAGRGSRPTARRRRRRRTAAGRRRSAPARRAWGGGGCGGGASRHRASRTGGSPRSPVPSRRTPRTPARSPTRRYAVGDLGGIRLGIRDGSRPDTNPAQMGGCGQIAA